MIKIIDVNKGKVPNNIEEAIFLVGRTKEKVEGYLERNGFLEVMNRPYYFRLEV